MLGISTELRTHVSSGVKFRAYLGAGVSAADMVSDSVMVSNYYAMGDAGTANGLLAMIAANLVWQALVVVVQTRGLGERKWKARMYASTETILFYGTVLVLTLLAPAGTRLGASFPS